MEEESSHFARLVSLACHDLRTPLATVHGFARTLERIELPPPGSRYLTMIELATGQLAELLDVLGVAARIEGGRWEPNVQEADLAELAATALDGAEAVELEVAGDARARVLADVDAVHRAVRDLAVCAVRHGGVDRLEARVSGEELRLAPVGAEVAPIVLGDDLRDLGAAVGVQVVRALGGSVALDGETLVVRLPAA
jgi:signal transduction histidine kinase